MASTLPTHPHRQLHKLQYQLLSVHPMPAGVVLGVFLLHPLQPPLRLLLQQELLLILPQCDLPGPHLPVLPHPAECLRPVQLDHPILPIMQQQPHLLQMHDGQVPHQWRLLQSDMHTKLRNLPRLHSLPRVLAWLFCELDHGAMLQFGLPEQLQTL